MSRKFRLLQTLVFLLFVAVFSFGQTTWEGSYTFDEDGGKTTGGTVIFITHELTISADGEGLVAMIESNGYQTSSGLIGTAKVEGPKLLVYFQSYGENNTFEPYKEGDLLFSLERKEVNGKPVILTQWGKFTPALPKNIKSGKVYFQKATEKKL